MEAGMNKLFTMNKATIALIGTAVAAWMGDWIPGADANLITALEVVIVAALVWLVPNAEA